MSKQKPYEVMYVTKPIEKDAYEAIIAKLERLITDNGGIVEKTDRWGKKRLLYEIQNLNEGLYALTEFYADTACVKELDRVMKITDDVLRHMIIRTDDFQKG